MEDLQARAGEEESITSRIGNELLSYARTVKKGLDNIGVTAAVQAYR